MQSRCLVPLNIKIVKEWVKLVSRDFLKDTSCRVWSTHGETYTLLQELITDVGRFGGMPEEVYFDKLRQVISGYEKGFSEDEVLHLFQSKLEELNTEISVLGFSYDEFIYAVRHVDMEYRSVLNDFSNVAILTEFYHTLVTDIEPLVSHQVTNNVCTRLLDKLSGDELVDVIHRRVKYFKELTIESDRYNANFLIDLLTQLCMQRTPKNPFMAVSRAGSLYSILVFEESKESECIRAGYTQHTGIDKGILVSWIKTVIREPDTIINSDFGPIDTLDNKPYSELIRINDLLMKEFLEYCRKRFGGEEVQGKSFIKRLTTIACIYNNPDASIIEISGYAKKLRIFLGE